MTVKDFERIKELTNTLQDKMECFETSDAQLSAGVIIGLRAAIIEIKKASIRWSYEDMKKGG